MSPRTSKTPKSDNGNLKRTGRVKHALTFPAMPVRQGNVTIYAFKAKASELFAALSINRRIQDKDEGYQRVLSPARVESIKQYVKARPIPGAIIVSLDNATFSHNHLTIPAGTDVGWVIDGQHRLAGAAQAARDGSDVELPVVAFVGLDINRQIEQFVTINREGKNVPTSLYLDLLHHLPHKKAGDFAKERAADLASQLRKDEASPFFERIVVTIPPKSGQTISLTNFVRKIFRHVAQGGILGTYTEREQYGVIANYYDGFRQVFSKEFDARDSMFFKTLGFGALWNVFPTVFSLTLKIQSGFTVSDVAAVLRRVGTVDFATWSQYGTGDQAERTAADDFRTTLLIAFQHKEEAPASLKLV